MTLSMLPVLLLASLCWLPAQGRPIGYAAASEAAAPAASLLDNSSAERSLVPPVESSSVATASDTTPPITAVPISSQLPRLQPLVSTRQPFQAQGTGPVTSSSLVTETGTTSGPIKGVFLARHMYGRATAVEAMGSKPPFGGITFNRCRTASRLPLGGCPVGINYYGSTVMRTLKLVPMFYGSWTDTQKSLIATFLSGLGGSSWMGINALYSDTSGYSSNALGMYANQTVTFSTNTYGNTLSDDQVELLVQQGISALTGAAAGAGGDVDTIYLMFTGPEVTLSSGFCSNYCGWHNFYTQSNGVTVKYAFIGNAITQCANGCIPGALTDANTPNGDRGVDGLFSVAAHEITEAASDPLLDAWYDNRGRENADKCAWQFGTTYTTGTGQLYNVRDVNGRYYLLQKNFNPKTGTCVTGV